MRYGARREDSNPFLTFSRFAAGVPKAAAVQRGRLTSISCLVYVDDDAAKVAAHLPGDWLTRADRFFSSVKKATRKVRDTDSNLALDLVCQEGLNKMREIEHRLGSIGQLPSRL